MDYWLEYSACVVSGAALEPACAALSDYLALRTTLVGHGLTIADLAVWGQLAGTPMWGKIRSGGRAPHLARWFDHVAAQPAAREAVEALAPAKKAAPAAAGAGGKGAGACAPALCSFGGGRCRSLGSRNTRTLPPAARRPPVAAP